jgi:hypothetical protein
MPGAAAVEVLLVIVQVECVKVRALAVSDLLDAKDLAAQDRNCLPRPGFHEMFEEEPAISHGARSSGAWTPAPS